MTTLYVLYQRALGLYVLYQRRTAHVGDGRRIGDVSAAVAQRNKPITDGEGERAQPKGKGGRRSRVASKPHGAGPLGLGVDLQIEHAT
jgi:hypothetical protein